MKIIEKTMKNYEKPMKNYENLMKSRFDAYLHQYMQSLPYTGYLVNESHCDLGAEALQTELRTLFVSELN